MARHFETKKEAQKFHTEQRNSNLGIWKKIKGHKNRIKKPFVVCSYIEWLNLY